MANGLDINVNLSGVVLTNDKCEGSNRCVRACDYFGTNSAVLQENGRYSFVVDDQKCISCGSCIEACQNGARTYVDDTEAFFDALKNGEEISVLVSQMFSVHYPEDFESVFGGLRNLGVKNFISAGIGGDIITWSYINYMKTQDINFMITQYCPAIVNYIVRFTPELRKHLAPLQSPIISTAIYAKNELKIDHKLALIGSCISKKTEFESYRGEKRISYNLTFKGLMEYVRKNNIYGEKLKVEFDEGLGITIPSKGVISQNFKDFLGADVLTRQIHGVKNVHNFLKANESKILNKELPYRLLEITNCEDGCVYGKGIENLGKHNDDALIRLMQLKKSAEQVLFADSTPEEKLAILNERFKNLKIEDYMCEYLDVSYSVEHKVPSKEEKEEIYKSLGKVQYKHRQTNCACCGYNTCEDMVYAIHNGYNVPNNCIHFIKEEVLKERDKVVKAEMYKELAVMDALTGLLNRNAFIQWQEEIKDLSGYGIIMFDLNDLKKCNDNYGHQAGDEYIILAAEMIKKVFGRFGFSYRIGGDEFCTVLKETDLAELDRAAVAFEELQAQHNNSRKYEFDISVPYGYAFYDKIKDKTGDNTRKRADEFLYANKARMKREKSAKGQGRSTIYFKDFTDNIEF